MSIRIAIASQKGGVGKTTCAMNLSVALSELGYRVLLIDTDPQGAINLSLKKGHSEFAGLVDVLNKKAKLTDVLIQTKSPGLSLLPKGRLAMSKVPQYEQLIFVDKAWPALVDACDPKYDFILMDTPAGMGMITQACMRAASDVMVPTKADFLSLRSVHQVLQVIDALAEEGGPSLLGFVVTMFEKEQAHSYKVAGDLWRDFPQVFETTIPRSDVYLRASELGVPLAFLSKKTHPEGRRFTALAQEVLNTLQGEPDGSEEEIRHLL
ncbi:MAG: ParA family protein [Acidobacteria bacterium]|nr:ParA family protein [Acidobacteriota bacterium]